LAVDPKGRACMVGALEKQKFVYVLNRDTDAQLTISSPLEAHKSYHIVYDIVGMDMGFENPQFAAIELDYGEVDVDPSGEAAEEAMKQLVMYELDLGLNSMTRKSSVDIDNGASKLIALPGVADNGPGGRVGVLRELHHLQERGCGRGGRAADVNPAQGRIANRPWGAGDGVRRR
jgi:splicing factor 3B subunit 3